MMSTLQLLMLLLFDAGLLLVIVVIVSLLNQMIFDLVFRYETSHALDRQSIILFLQSWI